MDTVKYLSKEELESGLDYILKSPDNNGEIQLIVCRPDRNKREMLETGKIDHKHGLVGDNWSTRDLTENRDLSEHIDRQITIANSRSIDLMAGSKDRWALAGDQFYVDMNIGVENLPPGTKLAIGTAVIEVTDKPHNGCKKFKERYGLDAMIFVNSDIGKKNHLRGINAKVITEGIVRLGDRIKKL